MKPRPIIFDGESVRAILEDRKTQTRRVVKPQPPERWNCYEMTDTGARWAYQLPSLDWHDVCCPYGAPGDELWVRERWAVEDASKLKLAEYEGGQNPAWIFYRDPVHIGTGLSWRPSIHMPRWASRITLRVTDVRVERVQEISTADAKAEGVETDEFLDRLDEALSIAVGDAGGPITYPSARSEFERRWDAINAKRGFGWAVNPWVWAVTFERVKRTEEAA